MKCHVGIGMGQRWRLTRRGLDRVEARERARERVGAAPIGSFLGHLVLGWEYGE